MNRRQEIIDYVRGKYGADIEMLWEEITFI